MYEHYYKLMTYWTAVIEYQQYMGHDTDEARAEWYAAHCGFHEVLR